MIMTNEEAETLFYGTAMNHELIAFQVMVEKRKWLREEIEAEPLRREAARNRCKARLEQFERYVEATRR
jgi:hypothetical protein